MNCFGTVSHSVSKEGFSMGNKEEIKRMIESGKTALGLEFGSTRIKAVLVDDGHNPIASGDQ